MLSQPRNHLSAQSVSVVSPSFRFTERDNEGRRPLRVGCEKEETMLSRCGADGHLGVPFVADAGGGGVTLPPGVPARHGTGIITRFPFLCSARVGRVCHTRCALPLLAVRPRPHHHVLQTVNRSEDNLTVRIDSPKVHCVSLGTFPHFSLQSSHLNHCYYHQDLHWGLFPPASRLSVHDREPPRPPTHLQLLCPMLVATLQMAEFRHVT